ncbi:MAG: T9SS type A sorting domain-containing protein, partial [Bacteroidetes bacterium]|nr:T9SS type A sorting domain-containing protein [Bacteroidota bacterium]
GRLNAYRALQKAQSLLNNNTVAAIDSFKATYNCNTIQLSWKKNINNNNVVVVYSNVNDIGTATNGTQYSMGNSFGYNSKVVYMGNASNITIPCNDSMLHFFKVFSADANNNYSLGRTVELVTPAYINTSGTIQQNFDFLPLYPTQQWRTINPDNDISWIHTVQDTAHTGAGDAYSMCMYNYKYNTLLGAVDILTSPLINIQNSDSIKLSFWYAYQYRSTGLSVADSFEVLVSTDCGKTFTSLWQKAGADLGTTTATTADTAFYPFGLNKWKNISLDISSYKNNKNLQFAFRAVNGKGNNLFLDNIGIAVLFKTDMAVSNLISLSNTSCDRTIQPVVTLVNKGYNSITSSKINYSIDGGDIITTNFTGNINKGDSAQISLNVSNLSSGNHTIKIYSSLPNNTADSYLLNDTLQYSFYVNIYIDKAISENFESNTLLPKDWTIHQNIDDEITWTTTSIAAKNSNKSIAIKNYVYRDKGKMDDLITPAFVCTKNYDSAFITFDYAYALRRLTDSTFFDTLQIDYTKDCGATWNTLWKKTGKALTTFSQTQNEVYEFIPEQNQWKYDSILLSTNFKIGDIIQVRFRNTNLWGNTVYLDNINLFAKFYPQGIQEKGYAIYPNPTNSIINIQHLNTPTTLKTIELINSIGRKVKTIQFTANADKDIQLNVQGLASDVYFLRLIYTDKTIVEKFVKVP